jgi:methylenetetrahydrofolate dehydrogenase (NADP+)/methenyltetrahydrofolate cyclohydrolase
MPPPSAQDAITLAKRIDGTQLAKSILDSTARGVKELIDSGWLPPSLVSISFGGDNQDAIARYVRNQKRAAERCHIRFHELLVEHHVSRDDMLKLMRKINVDPQTTGLIMQRPVPSHLSVREIQEAVHPLKDVEGMHPSSIGSLVYGEAELAPCTARAAVACLRSTSLGNRRKTLRGLECVVVGHSEIVGKPISFLLMNEGATVTTCHHMTKDLASHTRMADAVFVAVGKPGLIKGSMLKPGAAVIDVGINPSADGTGVVGDVDYESCLPVVGWITPVPGGVGPVTTAILMENTLRAALRQREKYESTYGRTTLGIFM